MRLLRFLVGWEGKGSGRQTSGWAGKERDLLTITRMGHISFNYLRF